MNDRAFDALVRGFAARHSRRTTLRQLGFAPFIASIPRGTRWAAADAAPAQQADCALCDDICVDIQTDPNNCGACGVVCGFDEVCRFGFCGPAPACDGWLVLCGETCVDLQNDQRNCGRCGQGCQNWERCLAGVCVEDPLPDCPPGLNRCDDFCVDLLNDDDNCGDCRRACQLFITECREGRCVVVEEPHIPGS